jgi:hypothetical protein
MASRRVTVRLDAEMRRRLEMFAGLRDKTPSEVVREALAGYLPSGDQDRSCYDLAREHGLIGAVRNAPRDLSTNRKRLQGFGRR